MAARHLQERLPRVRPGGELANVAALKFNPALRIVAEPPAQPAARRHVPPPAVELERGLLHAAGPEPLDQETETVPCGGALVDTFELDGCHTQEACSDPARAVSGCATWNALCYQDRKSTRLNSSHSQISYAVFCLK